MTHDEQMMRRALALAVRGRGTTRPNPMVGCVIARGEKILAEGWHVRPGGDHAEVAALRKIGAGARGATAYVTLEPCDHHGRTGPCTRALIDAGIGRVVFASGDPNPRVDGKGMKRLSRAGIRVERGTYEAESRALNRGYEKWITTGRPWVTLKAAVTLDGRIATRSGDSKWLSGERSRREAHKMRAAHDAILVGAGTVRADDPQLTVRGVRGRDPQRVIVDGKLSVPRKARALPGSWVLTTKPGSLPGATMIRIGTRATIPPAAILDELGRREITSVLIEGGGEVHGAFLRAGVVDEVALFVVDKLIGGDGVPLLGGEGAAKMKDAWHLEDVRERRIGDDRLIIGRPVRGTKRG